MIVAGAGAPERPLAEITLEVRYVTQWEIVAVPRLEYVHFPCGE